MFAADDSFTFDTDDGALAYRDTHGEGPPVVLLHAGFLDSTMFEPQLSALNRYRVIAPDARGHGNSANATRPFRQADDVAALLHHLGLPSAVLVGVSMGAMIAIETAVEHPALVAGLVVGGRGLGEPQYRDPWSQRVAHAQEAALARGDMAAWMDAFTSWAAGPTRALQEVDQGIVNKLRQAATRTLSKHTAPEPDYLLPVSDLAFRARTIDVPVFAIDGALDSPDLTATVDRFLDAIPHARSAALDHAAHYPNMEQPAAYNALVESFIDRIH
ncbi:alpha/beta fold hydrolase [Rhodococcus sp. SJ-2]